MQKHWVCESNLTAPGDALHTRHGQVNNKPGSNLRQENIADLVFKLYSFHIYSTPTCIRSLVFIYHHFQEALRPDRGHADRSSILFTYGLSLNFNSEHRLCFKLIALTGCNEYHQGHKDIRVAFSQP